MYLLFIVIEAYPSPINLISARFAAANVYEKYFMVDNIDVNQVELYDKTLDLIDMIKDFLAMYAF